MSKKDDIIKTLKKHPEGLNKYQLMNAVKKNIDPDLEKARQYMLQWRKADGTYADLENIMAKAIRNERERVLFELIYKDLKC